MMPACRAPRNGNDRAPTSVSGATDATASTVDFPASVAPIVPPASAPSAPAARYPVSSRRPIPAPRSASPVSVAGIAAILTGDADLGATAGAVGAAVQGRAGTGW